MAALLALAAASAPAAPLLGGLGPDAPPAGRSAFSEVFADGVPYPFTAILDRLRGMAGAGNVQTALIPLGRSLQRFSADPDYFASPRLVVGVTGDRAGPEAPHLASRLFIGYQPASEAIEAISYNEAAGRFEFEEIVEYAADAPRRIEPATRAICAACHQGQGPIFARPLWSETNANPAIAERLAGLGDSFHGAPRRQTVDAMEAFDAATDAAARIPLANRLWSEGCADPPCRAALLVSALRYGLSGAGPIAEAPQAAAFAARARDLWPEGFTTTAFDLPNRDPAPLLARMAPAAIIETTGAANPETPRAPVPLWRPGANAFVSAAREIAAMLAPGDFAAVDAMLRRERPVLADVRNSDCTATAARRPDGGEEIRFSCAGEDGVGAVSGRYPRDGGPGRIDTVRFSDQPPLRRLAIVAAPQAAGDAIVLAPARAAPDIRLANGFRVIDFTISDGGASGAFRSADDFTPLAEAVAQAAGAGDPAFGSGPFRRRAILATLSRIMEPAHE